VVVSTLNQATSESALSIRNLRHTYTQRGALAIKKKTSVEVLKDISLEIPAGKTLGLVGESGCGKTTLVKAILRLIEPTSGEILLRSDSSADSKAQDILTLNKSEMTAVRRNMQVVFQDPYGSLNPRMSVFQTVSEPLHTHLGMTHDACKQRVSELLDLVGLDPILVDRYPHEFSGGQRQRVGIARALAFEPSVLILDEPVSALDVSVQAQILNLIIGLQKKLNLTYLFVSHDLAVIQHVADQVAVMYLGKIVEYGAADEVFSKPAHPYTQALLSASPIPDVDLERKRKRIVLRGDISSSAGSHLGCQFANRCPVGADDERCKTESPILQNMSAKHQASCHYPAK
jgi:oligopeptide/dipeptide ABC transporter ATP-binding protein